MEEKKSFNLITLISIGTVVILLVILLIFSVNINITENVTQQTGNNNVKVNESVDTGAKVVEEDNEYEFKDAEYIEYEIQNRKITIPKRLETEIKWQSENITGKNIDLESEEGKLIQEYLEIIYSDEAPLFDQILEFDNIQTAPREYLFACALSNLLEEKSEESRLKENLSEQEQYIYNTASYAEFNEMLIKIFGNDADGLIDETYIEKSFSEKNPDGRFELGGYCGPEWNYYINTVKSIEKRDDIFYIEMYEYRQDYSDEFNTVWENIGWGNENPENYIDYKEYFYNRSGKLITTINYKFVSEKNDYEAYYEDGKKATESKELFIEKFSDRMSIRGLEIQYNKDDNSLNLLKNRLLTD